MKKCLFLLLALVSLNAISEDKSVLSCNLQRGTSSQFFRVVEKDDGALVAYFGNTGCFSSHTDTGIVNDIKITEKEINLSGTIDLAFEELKNVPFSFKRTDKILTDESSFISEGYQGILSLEKELPYTIEFICKK